MPSQPSQPAPKTPPRNRNSNSNPSHLFASRGKTAGRELDSETIAADIAAFKKAGGRIEVLGTTPLRARAAGSPFSRGTARRATATAAKPPRKTASKAASKAATRPSDS